MKKIICDVCGGSEFKRVDNSFICKNCGLEYDIETVKKLMLSTENTESYSTNERNKEKEEFELNNKIKTMYDLWCWKAYYEKERELKEFHLNPACSNVSDSAWLHRYENLILKKLSSKELEERYKHYVETLKEEENQRRKEYDAESEKISAHNSKALTEGMTIAVIIMILCTAILVALFLQISYYYIMYMSCGSLDGLFLLFLIFILASLLIAFFTYAREPIIDFSTDYLATHKYKYHGEVFIPNMILSYEKWLQNTAEYDYLLSQFYTKYHSEILPSVKQQYAELDLIREDYLCNMSIPLKYTKEEIIDSLLTLFLDNRADTLKEAINIYEMEIYQNKVLKTLEDLNFTMQSVTNEINRLTKTIQQVGCELINTNKQVESRLNGIDKTVLMLTVHEFFSD